MYFTTEYYEHKKSYRKHIVYLRENKRDHFSLFNAPLAAHLTYFLFFDGIFKLYVDFGYLCFDNI